MQAFLKMPHTGCNNGSQSSVGSVDDTGLGLGWQAGAPHMHRQQRAGIVMASPAYMQVHPEPAVSIVHENQAHMEVLVLALVLLEVQHEALELLKVCQAQQEVGYLLHQLIVPVMELLQPQATALSATEDCTSSEAPANAAIHANIGTSVQLAAKEVVVGTS